MEQDEKCQITAKKDGFLLISLSSHLCSYLINTIGNSVTRWLECLFNILPFTTMKIRPIAYKICQN